MSALQTEIQNETLDRILAPDVLAQFGVIDFSKEAAQDSSELTRPPAPFLTVLTPGCTFFVSPKVIAAKLRFDNEFAGTENFENEIVAPPIEFLYHPNDNLLARGPLEVLSFPITLGHYETGIKLFNLYGGKSVLDYYEEFLNRVKHQTSAFSADFRLLNSRYIQYMGVKFSRFPLYDNTAITIPQCLVDQVRSFTPVKWQGNTPPFVYFPRYGDVSTQSSN